jgi:hypothetical protein
LFVRPIAWLSIVFLPFVDQVLLGKGVIGFAQLIGKSGEMVRKWQTGFVASYLMWMIVGIIGLIAYYLIKF